jgi:hypothetical protein
MNKRQARAHVLTGIATSFDPASGWDPADFLGLDGKSPADCARLHGALYEVVAELYDRGGM